MDETNQSILLCYADDGERICDLIASSSRTFTCKVLKHNISVRRTPRSFSSFLLILTPEMLEELENRPKHFLREMVFHFQNKVFLYHESLDIQNSGVRRSLEYQCPDIFNWRNYKTGDNDANFLQMCLEIFSLTNMQNIQVPILVSFKLTPKKIWSRKDDIVISFKKPIDENNLKVCLKHQNGDCEMASLLKLNDKTYKFCPERMPEGEVTVEAFEHDASFGRTSFTILSKMHLLSELLDDVVNPIEFLCSTLSIENRETLDLILSEKFTNWKTTFPLAAAEDRQNENLNVFVSTACSEIPTILHFAAKYELSRLCKTLMKYPGYRTARVMKNKDGMTPSDLALTAGHVSLSEDIRRTEYGSDYEEIQDDSGYLTFGSEEHDERHVYNRREPTRRCRYRSLPTPCLDRDSGIYGSAESQSDVNTLKPLGQFQPNQLRQSILGGKKFKFVLRSTPLSKGK